MVNIIIGTNAPRLMQLIVDELEQYVKFKNGEVQREFVSIYRIRILPMDTVVLSNTQTQHFYKLRYH